MELALYRKYRPQSFEDVVGQEHIVSVLKNEAKNGKVSHAYLFSGSRGTGKTSVARIFAKSLGVNSEDIYEIDAASNRGIDEIREIRDAVNTYPYSSPYKIYIVDEAHMLTREAWNAFLKTLEEPPSHVIFIMATTEEHKLPDTVISRCESFRFKKPIHTDLVTSIVEVSKKEKYKIEKRSASLIATLAEGSFRDAFSILQKVIHFSSDSNLSHEEIEKVLGAPKSDYVLAILESISEKNTKLGIDTIKKAVEENSDMKVFLKMILRCIRFVILLRFSEEMKNFIINETSEEEFEKLQNLSKKAININSKVLINFLENSERQGSLSLPELAIELALIQSCGEGH